ncbi:M23 family metallopeptidase [Risungbinella massiliensis]|uniref:M23 family metallopeptidase n=1 Tax=Risungbinella massiliensis TaxID=1329796 RepID=UPI00069C6CFB|nr:M23 family metallopeptidase [Risungbinella massiliensis]
MKRFLIVMLILVAIIGLGVWYLVGEGYVSWEKKEIREFRLPDKQAKNILNISAKYDIPWYYLAAWEEEKYDYTQTTSQELEKIAKAWRSILGEQEATEKNLREVMIQEQSQAKVEKVFQIADAYQWQAEPLTQKYAFPFAPDVRKKVSYSNSWGDPRSFGGKRQHEGIDLFAPMETPLVAVTKGKVVKKGWNTLGGWTVTIQDEEHPQFFYYYAHLHHYPEGLEQGDIVTKGQVIGYVGDSGYGPEGTTGKFAPHLHFGMYVRSGYIALQREAVNPYVFLRMWDPDPKK